jgi:NodT family efflux transporter outer membrane factor (OMF) lipoprotein
MNNARHSLASLPILTLTLAVLAGCTVGPDYQKPDVPLPEKWVSTDQADPVIETQEAWWKNFHDPVLEQLIQKAADNNLDLKIAEARIAEARADRSSADAALLPTGDVKASGTREGNQFAIPGNFPGLTKPFNIFTTGFDASWELDLFGGKRREIESASAALQASEATRDDALISLLAEVARTYVDIRRYQKQFAITQDTIKSNQETKNIAQQRFKAGDVAGIDVTLADTQLTQAESQLPSQQNALAQAELSMDVLLGAEPGISHTLIGPMQPIPVSNSKLVLMAPAAVIDNRPDIRVAERKLAASTAEQGAAAAKFYPDISLTGFFGLLNTHADNLLTGGSKSWLAAGSVVWPILNYGQLSANQELADAQQQEALANYQKTVIAALSDVEKSLTSYTDEDAHRQALAKTVASARHAYQIQQQRYKEGLTAFIDVLDAERTVYAAESQLADATAQTSENLVAVYKSLGGGWTAQNMTGASK